MATEKEKKAAKPKEDEALPPLDEDLRFRYIGFDVFGKSTRDFFRSEEEKKRHEEAVREYERAHYSPFRQFTAVKKPVLTSAERIVLTIASVLLIVSAFLPWMSFKSTWVSLKFIGLTGMFQALQYSSLINLFNPRLMFFVYVPALLALAGLVFGIISLIAIYTGAKTPENYLKRLKRVLGLQWFVLAGWLFFFVVSVVGVKLPFGAWMAEAYGLRGIGDSFNIVSFTALAGIGVWVSIAGLAINSVKSNDL